MISANGTNGYSSAALSPEERGSWTNHGEMEMIMMVVVMVVDRVGGQASSAHNHEKTMLWYKIRDHYFKVEGKICISEIATA